MIYYYLAVMMKYYQLLLLTCLTMACTAGYAQAKKEKNKEILVYQCLRYNDSVHVKQTEVSIAHWLAYVYAKFEDHPDGDPDPGEVAKFLPDSVEQSNQFLFDMFLRYWKIIVTNELDEEQYEKFVWNSQSVRSFPLYLTKEEKKEYDHIKTFLNKPITGLTFEAIEEFMIWQSEVLDGWRKEDENYTHEVRFLPRLIYDDLIESTKTGLRNSKEKDGTLSVVGDSVNLKGCHLYNYKGSQSCPMSEGRFKEYGTLTSTVAVDSYNPDIDGYYNLLGNVAEMTATKGIAKGGHWGMYASEILKNEDLKYSTPSSKIGFRFMVVVRK